MLVPAVKYIRPGVLPEILNYISKGGIALIIPESFEYDQYAREESQVSTFGVSVKDVTLPPEQGRGEKVQNYDQSFSQAVLYGDVRKKITCEAEDIFSGRALPDSLISDGLVQTIDPGPNRILARFVDGRPALVLVKIGKGRIYYLAAPLQTADYHLILSPLASFAGLNRPVVAIGIDGYPVTGAEVRSVERKSDYLVYASNLSDEPVEFDLAGAAKIEKVLDLRSMKIQNGRHIRLTPFQETIFRIDKK